MGSLAAGGAAAMGSGAFTAMSAERDADINVVADDSGLIALVDEQPGDTVHQTDNPGELAIDFSGMSGDAGVNVNSRYQLGEFADKGWALPDDPLAVNTGSNVMEDPAFSIVNNDTVNHEITVSYDIDQSDIGGARVYWQFEDEARQYTIDLTGTTTSGSATIDGKGADPAPEPGDAVGAALFIDTRDYNGDPDDLDLSGTLTVSAD